MPSARHCWKVKWTTIGEGALCLMCAVILVYFPPQTLRSTPIHLWHSPPKTPFLPLAVPALGQGFQTLVVSS